MISKLRCDLMDCAAGLFTVPRLRSLAASGPVHTGGLAADDASAKVYVAPGEYDEFYVFMSGGFSGQVAVYGLPSGRLLKRHPRLLAVRGERLRLQRGDQADAQDQLRLRAVGRRAPPEAVADRRRARRALAVHQRQQHAAHRAHRSHDDSRRTRSSRSRTRPATTRRRSSTPNTEYVVSATRFSVPTPQATSRSRRRRRTSGALLSFIKVGAAGQDGHRVPDPACPATTTISAHAGKGPSDGWSSSPLQHRAGVHASSSANASQNDKDFIAAVNWKRAEECVAQGSRRPDAGRVRAQLGRRIAHRASAR